MIGCVTVAWVSLLAGSEELDWNITDRDCGLMQSTWYENGHGLKFHLLQEMTISKCNPNWSINFHSILVMKTDHNYFIHNVRLAVELILCSYYITPLKRAEVMRIYVIPLHHLSIVMMKTGLTILCCCYIFRVWSVENRLWRKEVTKLSGK